MTGIQIAVLIFALLMIVLAFVLTIIGGMTTSDTESFAGRFLKRLDEDDSAEWERN